MSSEQEASSSVFGKSLFKSVWAQSQGLDSGLLGNPDKMPLGLILGSASVILVIVVVMVAYLAVRRSEEAMANLLAEKGSSLLMVFESALRTGMRGPVGLQLQTLLEEMTTSPDIEFVALTMPDGVILAHSDHERIGEYLKFEDKDIDAESIARLAPGEKEKWRITRSEGQRVFLLYRHFTLGRKDWSSDVPEPTIFLGMDVSPFEITNNQNRSYVMMLSLVTMLVGLACLLALWYAQRAAESRRRQSKAENEVIRLEQEVQRNEKMAAIGTLAAGVAHEIRNPLSSIKGYATYFSQRFPEGSDDREAATVMVNEVNRLNRVITDLLGLAKSTDVKLKPVNVDGVVKHVLRLLRQNAANKNVKITLRLAPHVPPVMADMERLSQALLNLCLNGLDAMPDGGELTIAVGGGFHRVCLLVRDTGEGISQEIMKKIFDPYFTTKLTGVGLGLPMVHKIITGHKGRIEVLSRLAEKDANGAIVAPGETTFKIWLPVALEADE